MMILFSGNRAKKEVLPGHEDPRLKSQKRGRTAHRIFSGSPELSVRRSGSQKHRQAPRYLRALVGEDGEREKAFGTDD